MTNPTKTAQTAQITASVWSNHGADFHGRCGLQIGMQSTFKQAGVEGYTQVSRIVKIYKSSLKVSVVRTYNDPALGVQSPVEVKLVAFELTLEEAKKWGFKKPTAKKWGVNI